MKRFILSVILFFPLFTHAQSTSSNDFEQLAEKAYNLNSAIMWDMLIDQYEFENKHNPGQLDIILKLCYSYYGLCGTYMSNYDKKLGVPATNQGVKYAKQLLTDPSYEALGYAFLSAFYGMQIGFAPMKGMTLGPKANNYIKKALKLDENEPFTYLQEGTSYFNTPPMFGGSKTKSIDSFKKSIELYNQQEDVYLPCKLEAMTWLAQAYMETDQMDKADETLNEILKIAPDNGWAIYLKEKQ